MFEKEPEKQVIISPEAFGMISKVTEEWTKSLPFHAVYKMAERFHFHLVTRLYVNDRENFKEMCEEFNVTEENFTEDSELDEVAQVIMMQLDALVGFAGVRYLGGEYTNKTNYPELPDSDFFKGLGLN